MTNSSGVATQPFTFTLPGNYTVVANVSQAGHDAVRPGSHADADICAGPDADHAHYLAAEHRLCDGLGASVRAKHKVQTTTLARISSLFLKYMLHI